MNASTSSRPPTARTELSALFALAIPLVVARAGHACMGLVDTLVAGRISSDAVAAVGLGSTSWFLVYVLPFGVLLGLDPLVSQSVGAGDERRWRAGLVSARWIALAVAVPAALAIWQLPDFLAWIQQPPSVVEVLRPYMFFMAIGVLPGMLFHAYGTYLTAHGHTGQFVAISVVVNVLNLVLDLWFVHGGLGVPPLGVAGIGAATAGCAIAEVVLLRWAMHRKPVLRALYEKWRVPDWDVTRRIVRTGVPVGVQYGFEVAGFTVVTYLVGLFGATTLAGHQVALSVSSVTFTVALGVSSAASVRVGQAAGAGQPRAVALAGRVALGVGLTLAACAAAAMALGRDVVAGAYTDDPATLEVASQFLLIAAAFQLADMVQAIGFGLLRGLDDTRIPVTFNVVAYWCLGVPLGAYAAFVLFDDPTWLWWGLTGALTIVAVALAIRFSVLSRRLQSSPQGRRGPG